MRRAAGICILVLVQIFALPALADYTKHFQQGRQYAKQGRHLDALREFDKALSIEHRPGAQYYKALSLIALGRFQEARPLLIQV